MARVGLSEVFGLFGQREGVLRGLCYIQFYDIFVELFEHGDGLGSEPGVEAASLSYISALLPAAVGHGEVNG